MQLFYDPGLNPDSTECVFGREESNHIIRVLRKKVGDEVHVTNGRGYMFIGKISDPSLTKCRIDIESVEGSVQKMHRLHMAVAPTKSMDRYEWFLEKATEIGVDEISPIICDRSERRVVKKHRMEKVLQSAMKQSLRSELPILNDAMPLKKFLEKDFEEFTYIAHCQEGDKEELKRRISADKEVLIMIGPEGDFTDEEIDLAESKGFMPVSLGETRLRTETAAILACATVSFINTR